MDNLFEYLIILFFIFSILQSFLGKKKKQQQQRQQQSQTTSSTTSTSKEKKQESTSDILEQLFGLKILEESKSTSRSSSDRNAEVLDPVGYHETTWNPEEDYEDSIGIETVRYSKKRSEAKQTEFIDPVKSLEKKISDAKKSMAKLPDSIEVEELSESEYSSSFVKNIRKKIANPESIREYILVSEILNKPKAHRR